MSYCVAHAVTELALVPGEPMGGYADRTGGITGVGHPLELHCLAIRGAVSSFALLVLDAVCVNTGVVDSVRAIARDHGFDDAWLTATHTHSGPETGCVPGGADTPTEVAQRIVDAARRVLGAVSRESGHVVDLRMVEARVAEVGSVRAHHPPRPEALPVQVLAAIGAGEGVSTGQPVEDRAGSLVGMLVVLPVHPTVLGAANTDADPDLAGAVRRAIGAVLRGRDGVAGSPQSAGADGPGPFVVVATGCAGDISTRNHRTGHDDLAVLSRRAADAVVHAVGVQAVGVQAVGAELAGADPGSSPAPGPLLSRDGSVHLPRKTRDTWHRQLELGGGRGETPRARYTRDQAKKLVTEAGLLGLEGTVGVRVATLQLDGCALAGIGGEPFLAVQQAVADHSPTPVAVLGYANGYVGYLPMDVAANVVSYEQLVSVAEPDAVPRLVDTVRDWLAESSR